MRLPTNHAIRFDVFAPSTTLGPLKVADGDWGPSVIRVFMALLRAIPTERVRHGLLRGGDRWYGERFLGERREEVSKGIIWRECMQWKQQRHKPTFARESVDRYNWVLCRVF